jgi:hypothetical protein
MYTNVFLQMCQAPCQVTDPAQWMTSARRRAAGTVSRGQMRTLRRPAPNCFQPTFATSKSPQSGWGTYPSGFVLAEVCLGLE